MADAVASLEKANADLEPELLGPSAVREQLALYARAEKLAAFGKTMLARRLDDAQAVARVIGTSVGKAKSVVETGKALGDADEVRAAFQGGDISLDQAAEIARAEVASPGSAAGLLTEVNKESFQALTDKARKVVLEAEQHRGLAQRQHEARFARQHVDPLGMVHLHLAFEPHIGTPIMRRAEVEAQRLLGSAKEKGESEPFERYLADAYGALLSGAPSVRPKRPELVMLVSYEVAKRGWNDVQEGELCTKRDVASRSLVPPAHPKPFHWMVTPVAPEVAREISKDAFLTGLFYDGKDLRHLKRWSRSIPVEVRIALELGEPPDFDGVKCTDCGSRYRSERDHVEPHVAKGPSSTDNLKWRCPPCHEVKTIKDLRSGKFTGDTGRSPPH